MDRRELELVRRGCCLSAIECYHLWRTGVAGSGPKDECVSNFRQRWVMAMVNHSTHHVRRLDANNTRDLAKNCLAVCA
jgi:hypothetical protein